uniref:serine O-acetyltransferase n=3 Tax=Auxenochlorella protothecoides TaxID=3075 RepID=A0A1D2ADZ1_AUXPR
MPSHPTYRAVPIASQGATEGPSALRMASQTTALHAAQTTPQPTRTVCARRHSRSPRGRPTARHMTRASTPTGAGGATLSAHGDPLNHKAEPPVSCPAGDRIWQTIREEAQRDSDSEALLSSFLHASILAHDSFPRALAFILAARLADATLLPSELSEIFRAALASHPSIVAAALADLAAVRERDPACSGLSQALLYYKGFHALQVQRIAHVLWHQGRRMMASALQSRSNEVFAVDIHPAARIGAGVLLDHGTGVVIGATAVIGANVSILQNVTLGGTGKESGDRHPKIGDYVLIGASATVLGNIRVGEGAQIAAGSLVLKEVPPHTMVAGSPAKEVGKITGLPSILMDQWSECCPRVVAEQAVDALTRPGGVDDFVI